jgi:hypothetical protein
MQIQQVNKNKLTFFTAIAVPGIIAILVGFLKTFIIPILSGAKTWLLAVNAHASFVFGWVLTYLTQSLLI